MSPKPLAILVPFFGPLPDYFDLFAYSASFFPHVDFYLMGDELPQSSERYPNFHFKSMSLPEFNALAAKKLGKDFRIESVFLRKFCDWKPLLGFLFSDLLADYSHWGYCDVDILLGNLSPYIDPLFLEQYDFISLNKFYCSGPFSIYKNSERVNTLFKQSTDWELVLRDTQKIWAFDEAGAGNWEKLWAGVPIDRIDGPIDSMTHIVRRLQAKGELHVYMDSHMQELLEKGEILHWKPGSARMITGNRCGDYALFHYVVHKHSSRFRFKKMVKPEEIFITYYGFFKTLQRAQSTLFVGSRKLRATVRSIKRRLFMKRHKHAA